MIQHVFIVKQDGKTPMLLKESAVACHLRTTPYLYNAKIALKQWVAVETGGM
ncbi:hypothetical protein QUF90_02220 [Desulfococcaceae bacterium HSG9]|nr:hypothetical protein [Desulfococcaceae bacterium HSG9]